jgi:hypothetical protein
MKNPETYKLSKKHFDHRKVIQIPLVFDIFRIKFAYKLAEAYII